MTVTGRMLGAVVFGLALGAMLGGAEPALASGDGGMHGGGSFRDGGSQVGGFYGRPDFKEYSFGSGTVLGRLSHYGRPVSPFPCPYPTLYVVPNGSAGSR
jgi:hypothetical protein